MAEITEQQFKIGDEVEITVDTYKETNKWGNKGDKGFVREITKGNYPVTVTKTLHTPFTGKAYFNDDIEIFNYTEIRKVSEINNQQIIFKNQEELEMYISAHFEDKYSKIMEAGFENGRKQAIEAIQQYPNLIGVNQFKLDIKAAIKAKKWYSDDDLKTFGYYVYAVEINNPSLIIDKGMEELISSWKILEGK